MWQSSRVTGSGVMCFRCNETGHRQSDCKKQGKKMLFADPDNYKEKDVYVCEEPVFDRTNTGSEQILEGDTGLVLVIFQMSLMPHANGDEWL